MEQEVIKIDMPAFQPDCCEECMLLGMRPKEEMTRGDLKPLKCILTGKAITIKLSKSRESEHYPLKRPCDNTYNKLFGDGKSYYPIEQERYISYVSPLLEKRSKDILREAIRDYKKWLKSLGKPMDDFYRYLVREYKSLIAESKEDGKE